MTRHPVRYGVLLFFLAYIVVIWYFQGVHRRAIAAKTVSSGLNKDPDTSKSTRDRTKAAESFHNDPSMKGGDTGDVDLLPAIVVDDRKDGASPHASPVASGTSQSSAEIDVQRHGGSSLQSPDASEETGGLLEIRVEGSVPQGLRPLGDLKEDEARHRSEGEEDVQGLRPIAEFSTVEEEGAKQGLPLHEQVSNACFG